MTTTNIGPCGCCGGGEGCPCTQNNCLFRWEYVAENSNWQWIPIDLCGGGDGSSEPCCACGEVGRNGDYDGEEVQVPCISESNGDRCSCCVCDWWWDSFLVEWVPNEGCRKVTVIDDVTYEYPCAATCLCSPPTEPGTTHGEISSPIFCGC